MNKKLWLLAILLIPALSWAQNRKIDLKLQLPLEEVLKTAQKENKYVFLDFGSPRCSPCLWLKKNVFTIDSIADFVNERFVSVDYQLGDEKKRLSAKYGVVGEPVLLILDNKGNLMHKMVGKCEPDEFMRRFRQGLDVNRNFVAQNKKFENGERSPEFIKDYLETIHIARETERLKELVNIFFNVPVEKLKEKTYWDVFVRYSEDPVGREMMYVFDNREEFYKLYGKANVESKINVIYGAKASAYIFGHKPPAKEAEFVKMLDYLQKTDYEKATEWLVYMVPAQYKYTDWVAMAKEIDNALRFNIYKGLKKESYMKMMAEQMCWYSNDKNALPYAVKWIDSLLPLLDNDETKKSVLGTKVSLLEKLEIKDGVADIKNQIQKLEKLN